MLYKFAHILRDKFPWLWDFIGVFNSWLFGIRYGRYNQDIERILSEYSNKESIKGVKLTFEELTEKNASNLAKMFSEQPDEAFEYFRPHAFDASTLKHLAADKSFLAYIVSTGGTVVGYFFQRSFFWGKAYRGYMTDYRWRRKGINKLMNLCATDISSLLKLKVFGTISPDNISSMKSAQSANNIKIIEQLANGDYFVEYCSKQVK